MYFTEQAGMDRADFFAGALTVADGVAAACGGDGAGDVGADVTGAGVAGADVAGAADGVAGVVAWAITRGAACAGAMTSNNTRSAKIAPGSHRLMLAPPRWKISAVYHIAPDPSRFEWAGPVHRSGPGTWSIRLADQADPFRCFVHSDQYPPPFWIHFRPPLPLLA